jgi:hypothetical protein
MESKLWEMPRVPSPNRDQVNIPRAPNYEGTAIPEFSNDIDNPVCQYPMGDDDACNTWNEQPISQMTSVPSWVDDALFGPLDSVSNSRAHAKNIRDVGTLGLPDGGGAILNNLVSRGRVSPNHVDQYSLFRFSDPLPGILPSKIDVASLRAANLTLCSLSNDIERGRAKADGVDIPGGCMIVSNGVKSRIQTLELQSLDQNTDFFASDPVLDIESYHDSYAEGAMPDVSRLVEGSAQSLDARGTGFDLLPTPQAESFSLGNGHIPTASSNHDTKDMRAERVYKLSNATSGCGLETATLNEQPIQLNEQELDTVHAMSVTKANSLEIPKSSLNISTELQDTERCSQQKSQNTDGQPSQRKHQEIPYKMGLEKAMIPQFNDTSSSRIHQHGCSDSGTKCEDIKLQRAQRNRESAKRSRLKSKLLHQKMTETYDRLKDENRALKDLVERLVEDCRSAPREVQDRLKAILHEKRAARDK